MSTKAEQAAQSRQGRIISLKEAADILGMSYPTAVRMANSGELKAFRIRKTWRTSDIACEEFINRQFKLQAARSRSARREG